MKCFIIPAPDRERRCGFLNFNFKLIAFKKIKKECARGRGGKIKRYRQTRAAWKKKRK